MQRPQSYPVAIFGRKTARQHLRTATQESLSIPTFGSAIDCTPWVTGGLWPAELSPPTADKRGLAGYLKTDLQRITRRANNELTISRRRCPVSLFVIRMALASDPVPVAARSGRR
jgi:hypothetical protein